MTEGCLGGDRKAVIVQSLVRVFWVPKKQLFSFIIAWTETPAFSKSAEIFAWKFTECEHIRKNNC